MCPANGCTASSSPSSPAVAHPCPASIRCSKSSFGLTGSRATSRWSTCQVGEAASDTSKTAPPTELLQSRAPIRLPCSEKQHARQASALAAATALRQDQSPAQGALPAVKGREGCLIWERSVFCLQETGRRATFDGSVSHLEKKEEVCCLIWERGVFCLREPLERARRVRTGGHTLTIRTHCLLCNQ